MDIKEIQNLIKFVSKSGVEEARLKEKSLKLQLERELKTLLNKLL